MSSNVVDLIAHKHRNDKPRLRIVIEIFDLPDGRIATESRVEEFVSPDFPALESGTIRSWAGWATHTFGRHWRLGLGSRSRDGWPKRRRR